MVHHSPSPALQAVTTSIQDARWSNDSPITAGDSLRNLGLGRLRLLAVFIALEDKFAIEFPPDAIDGFRIVADVATYIHAHQMVPYEDPPPAAVTHPGVRQPSIRDRLHRAFGRAFRVAGLARC